VNKLSYGPQAIKIELYDTADVLQYTLINQVLSAHVHDTLTSDIGSFNFTLPTTGQTGHPYAPVTVWWKAKIYMGYGTLTNKDLLMTGKILKTIGPLDTGQGYIRTFQGKDLGEILERRQKTNTRWQNLDASTIATIDIATDLGIYNPYKAEADTTLETITVRTEQYLDYLKKVSDYWDAGGSVQKDFFVDPEGDLMWKSRPIRTATTSTSGTADSGNTITTVDAERTEADDYWNGCFISYETGTNAGLSRLITDFHNGTNTIDHDAFPAVVDGGDTYTITGVETPTLGLNIKSYTVTRDIMPIKNNITVYGAPTATLPLDRDTWSELLDYNADTVDEWTCSSGVLTADAVAPIEGTYWIRCASDAGTKFATFKVEIPRVTVRDASYLRFWHRIQISNCNIAIVRLYAPNSTNYFQTHSNLQVVAGQYYNNLSIGDEAVYDADENPTGVWDDAHDGGAGLGNPNWWDIREIYFSFRDAGAGMIAGIDRMYFYPDRWVYSASDLTGGGSSGVLYGQRDAEFTDENLLSATECETRAKTLLYQLKDPAVRLDMTLKQGTSNLKKGDRLPITVPAEGLSAASFDVVSVDYDWGLDGFETGFSAVDSVNSRILPPLTTTGSLVRQIKYLKEVTGELYSRMIR
jgi:hypothetical protein